MSKPTTAECWSCGHCPTGQHGMNTDCMKAGHFKPMIFALHQSPPTAGRHAGHDVRPVAQKGGGK